MYIVHEHDIVCSVCCCSTNHYSEHVIDQTDLPRHLIKSATGDFLLQQTQPRVCQSPTTLIILQLRFLTIIRRLIVKKINQ